jgi:L,D-peptidoglycan transpeptidase YkuD (ErfK/YbiS/YcfS/YnhG family)
LRAAIGRAGMKNLKREGDGATPIGSFRLIGGFFRPDRFLRPRSGMKLRGLRPMNGWCDDTSSGQYNRPVRDDTTAGHESLWREDHVYDVIVLTDQNLRPRIKGRGSAIFFHLANQDFAPTAGCVAISAADMRRLLPRLARNATLVIRR